MGERLLCKQEVIGSIPFTSTTGVCIANALATGEAALRRKRRRGKRTELGRIAEAVRGYGERPGTLAKMRVCGRQSLARPFGLARDG